MTSFAAIESITRIVRSGLVTLLIFSGIFGGESETEVKGSTFIQNVYEALLESDVSLEAADKISSVP